MIPFLFLGFIYKPKDICASLKWILNEKSPPASNPVGVLTTLNRDDWADYRHHLEMNSNKSALKDIDGSILNLVFDYEEPTKDYKKIIQRYLHSDGSNRYDFVICFILTYQDFFMSNKLFCVISHVFFFRWFDKSLSLIIQKDGIAGLNFEHSWGDGVAVLRYFTDIYKDSTMYPQVHPDTIDHINPSQHLVQKLG